MSEESNQMENLKCVAGCKHFTDNEVKHHKDCPNNVKFVVRKVIDANFFNRMHTFLLNAIEELCIKGIHKEDIQIFIPHYVLEMFIKWYSNNYYVIYDTGKGFTFEDIKLLDNYDNTVVVSFKYIHLYNDRFEPAVLKVIESSNDKI